MPEVYDLECPGCAAPLSMGMKNCPKCFRPIIVSSFKSFNGLSAQELNKQKNTYSKALANQPNNIDLILSSAFCFLKLGLYDNAIEAFEKVFNNNFDNSEAYFYAAIALLKGKKAFVTERKVIDRALEYLEAATMLEPKGIYYLFQSYLKYDYYNRKYININPDYKEMYQMACENGLSEYDVEGLFEMLHVTKPNIYS